MTAIMKRTEQRGKGVNKGRHLKATLNGEIRQKPKDQSRTVVQKAKRRVYLNIRSSRRNMYKPKTQVLLRNNLDKDPGRKLNSYER